MKVLVIGGVSRSLVHFRGHLLQGMLKQGHKVMACAGEPQSVMIKKLNRMGIEFEPVHLSRAGMRPWVDLKTGWELYRAMCSFRPDVVLAYTIKPVIWGGLAARLANVPASYSLITGLGYAFASGNTWRGKVAGVFAALLYRMSLRQSRRVFFQNPDDMAEFVSRRLVQKKQCVLVNGSGVDTVHYGLAPLPPAPRFLMICRLVADKGVREYVAAARMLTKRYPEVKFRLVGDLDANPSSITRSELNQWQREGVIEYLGRLDDVRPAIADCNVYVLPSYYREGTPRTVLEAMSMGRAIITANSPGCRETIMLPTRKILDKNSKEIIQGENGFLVPVKNIEALVEAMGRFVMTPSLVEKMGRASRDLAERKYDVNKVNALMLKAMGLD